MVRYYLKMENYIEICRCFLHLSETKASPKWQSYLKAAVTFVLLAPFSQEQDDLAQRTATNKDINTIEELSLFADVLKDYLHNELISYFISFFPLLVAFFTV
jgi:hypothetical protein